MGKLVDMLFGLIAYLCVATVITLALIVGYLFHTDQLNNAKLFRLMAVVQDVDLQKMAADDKKSPTEVPPEEPSLNEVMNHQQIVDRNFEVKQLALQRGKQEYDNSYQLLVEQTARYDRLAQDLKSQFKQEQELTTQQNVAKVVSQLEQVTPDVGKDQLMRWIDEKKMDDAILLMSKMSESKLAKILKTFSTPEELTKLHEIHERIISSGADSSKLEKALDDLDSENKK
ncbi:MAG TPA: hypothetical protein VH107_02780 [Lacipirellulaceae bacterium]|jgi:hypothetical protein|nr:hypothetical protein [Lacipirellulaceae bacterium]